MHLRAVRDVRQRVVLEALADRLAVKFAGGRAPLSLKLAIRLPLMKYSHVEVECAAVIVQLKVALVLTSETRQP